MAQNITLLGASYSDVPSVTLPKTGGGTASFTDVTDTTATASDVAAGTYFYTAAGVRTEGTGSGGGGVIVTQTQDAGGGTIVEITATPISGTKSITANGTGIDVSSYQYADVAVPAPTPTLQTVAKSYTPSESQQTEAVTYGRGYDGIDTVNVTVGAISSTYVGSGVTQRASADLSASGATVTAPAGYYASAATKTISSGSATPASSISATGATVSTGTNTLTLSKSSVSNTPQVSAGYISSGTAGNSSVSLTASVTTKGAATITPGTSNQTIASGTYLTGTQTISGDANLVAGNIKDGTTIFGVTGSYTGGGGTLTVATKTITQASTTQTLTFSSLSDQPKYWFLRATTNVSSSGSTTYYYVTDCFYDGTNIKGNTFRIGSTRRVQNITSGISQSYSSGTLTITAGSASTATPGQFYGASNFGYELVYIY